MTYQRPHLQILLRQGLVFQPLMLGFGGMEGGAMCRNICGDPTCCGAMPQLLSLRVAAAEAYSL